MHVRRCALLIAALCVIDTVSSQPKFTSEHGARPSHKATPALRSAGRANKARKAKVHETLHADKARKANVHESLHADKARKAKLHDTLHANNAQKTEDHESSHGHTRKAKVDEAVWGEFSHPPWLQACKSIFLDLGTNNGVNIRKLYEPEKYGGAKLLPYLEEVFGQPAARRGRGSKTGLCALGLEPNPQRHGRLQMVQQSYQQQGWNVHFYPFAAWSTDGFMPLNMTGKKKPSTQLKVDEGSHLSSKSVGPMQTRTIDLAAFINSLPTQSVKLMIMDIEGAEYQSLAQLIQKNVLCQTTVQKALIAAHTWGEIEHWGDNSTFHVGVHPRSFLAVRQRMDQLKEYEWCAPGKVTEVAELDDSMYSQDLLDSPIF